MSSEQSAGEPAVEAPLPAEEHSEIRLSKRDLKRLHDPTRALDGWERYRALIDASDEAYDLIDISTLKRALR